MTDTTTTSMREDDWTSLVRSVAQGNCILMLGPDAVTGTFNGVQVPVLVGLAEYVKNKLGPEYAYLDASRPSAVAEVALDKEDPPTLQGWVEDFYANLDTESPVLANLAATPFELIINTSPGLSMEHAFSAQKSETRFMFYDRMGRANTDLPDPSRTSPLVYNLYGSLEQPQSLILSDSDRVDFLKSIILDDPPLPPKIKSALLDPKRTFLFLGFRLDRWQLKILLRVLTVGDQRKLKSFAFELQETALNEETKCFYESGHKIQWYDSDVEAFTTELLERVQALPTPDAADASQPVLPPDAPVVFLCHASEDKDRVAMLAADLERNGIRTWLDRENLRGGDRWDSMIRKTINEQVEYVVVIQSESLKNKDVGYVNREINLALDRQLEYRPPRRFLIPVFIDTSESKLPNLGELQSIDLSDEGDVDELVRAINLDLSFAAREV